MNDELAERREQNRRAEMFPEDLRTPFRDKMRAWGFSAVASEKAWESGHVVFHLQDPAVGVLCRAPRPKGKTFNFTTYAHESQCCAKCAAKFARLGKEDYTNGEAVANLSRAPEGQ